MVPACPGWSPRTARCVAGACTAGVAHRVVLVSDGATTTGSVDGVELLQASTTDQYLNQGRVLLGAAGRGAADVRFTDLRLRSGTSVDVPPLPALVSGDAVFTARMCAPR